MRVILAFLAMEIQVRYARLRPDTDPEQLRFAHGRPGRLQDGRAEAPQPIPPSDRLEKIHPAAINCAWEEAPMRMVLAIAALVSIAFGLIAVGRAWYEFRPLTDKERARLRQEGN